MSALTVPTLANAARGKGIVCFTWDDGYSSWPALADAADARGQAHTFAVTINQLTASGGVTAAQVVDLANRGHEIASHTVSHPDYSGASVATRISESDVSKGALGALVGDAAVTSFIYPYGGRTTTTDQELYGRYERIVDFRQAGVARLEERNQFLVPRVNNNSQHQALDLIRLAARQPVIVTLGGHNPGGSLMNGGAADALTLQNAIDQMEYAYSLGVPCLTLDQAFGSTGLLMNASFERFDLSTWRPYPGGVANTVAATTDTGIPGRGVAELHPIGTAEGGVRQIVPVIPGRSYTLSGRARRTLGTTGTTEARIMSVASYAGVDAGAPTGTVVATSGGITSSTWGRFSVAYTIPQGARFVDVQLWVSGQTSSDVTAQFDHIHFGLTEHGDFG